MRNGRGFTLHGSWRVTLARCQGSWRNTGASKLSVKGPATPSSTGSLSSTPTSVPHPQVPWGFESQGTNSKPRVPQSFMMGCKQPATDSRGRHCSLQRKVAQSCLTLCDPMDCSLPGSSIHGTLQARVLEWVAISFSRGSSRSGDRTQVSHIAG